MIAKIFALITLAAAAMSAQYPAGVHPAICPNYPYCDQNTLARFTAGGVPIPEWVSNPGLLPVAPVDPNHNAVPRYPANFNAALCPNYPYCF